MLRVISNRLPIKFREENNEIKTVLSSGGLATGISSLRNEIEMTWTGWPGTNTSDQQKQAEIENLLHSNNMDPVWITEEDYSQYYKGFNNRILWPLLHCFSQYADFREEYWESYLKVNSIFCDQLLSNASEDDVFWIHDYHLMLLPKLIRERLPNARIGFFLHIPFPPAEIFSQLPWREEILEGMSGADLIGFHTKYYTENYLRSIRDVLKKAPKFNKYRKDGRNVSTGTFPMGIDYRKFASRSVDEKVIEEAKSIKNTYKGQKVILSVDRLDYTKGILHRLNAFDIFLKQNPEYREKVSLLELVVPSRFEIPEYKQIKKSIDEVSGRINGRYGSPFWTPVKYLYRSVEFETLCAMYLSADIAMITPLRDGMNLVAKEYVSVKQNGDGILLLSEFAGASKQLKDALSVNPNNLQEVAKKLKEGLEMDTLEMDTRMNRMQKVVRESGVRNWADEFIHELNTCSLRNELTYGHKDYARRIATY